MIGINEESDTTISRDTKSFIADNISVDVLKRYFKIHKSFEFNPRDPLSDLANCLHYQMPGAKQLIEDFWSLERTVTLVYDPYLNFPFYGDYSGVSGKSIVLKSFNAGEVMEEFFHAYWALWLTPSGGIKAYDELEAELDAKIYVSFVMSARNALSESAFGTNPKDMLVKGPLEFYKETCKIFQEEMHMDYYRYFQKGGHLTKYTMDENLYRRLYDAFARDMCHPEKVGTLYNVRGIPLIFRLLNNRWN